MPAVFFTKHRGLFLHKILRKLNTNLMKLDKNIDANLQIIKNELNSEDVTFLDLQLGDKKGTLIFINDIVDKNAVGELILRPASQIKGVLSEQELYDLFLSPEKTQLPTIQEIINDVLLGNTVLIAENCENAISFGLKFFEKRAITEPPTSTVIKGPREGFVESLPVNISLMRRKLKSPDLRFENVTVGKYSRTPVALCYIKGIVDDKLVKTLKSKLSQIDIDAILDSSYLSKCLGERKVSLFKQIGNTEKPDILAGKILEGRVAIFVDGSPIALTVPYLLIEDFQSASDYYNSAYSATFARQIRLLSVFVALFLPALFVSAELFHLQLIPLSFLLTIVNSIKGIPLSPSFEMFFTLMIFEILNEASVRMPKYVGMVVSIVGGLVLGETAVTAGIISAPTLMIIALSGICLYTVPELEQTFSILRMLFLVIAGTAGLYGLLIAVSFIFIYIISFESYGAPIFAPFSPLVKDDLKDTFYKGFLHEHQFRPKSFSNKNQRRLRESEAKNNEE